MPIHACCNVAACGGNRDLIVEQQCAATQPQHAVLEGPVRPLLQARSMCIKKGLGAQATQAGGTSWHLACGLVWSA